MKRMVFLLVGTMMMFLSQSRAQPPIPTAGLQLWLKADAGVDTLNGTVSRWHDQSGNGNDVIQSNPFRQPLLVNNELNGKPVLRFDGSNDRLGFTGSKLMNHISLFTVLKNKSGDGFVLVFGPGGILGGIYNYVLKMGFPNNSNTDIAISTGKADNPYDGAILATAPNINAYGEWRNIDIVSDSTIYNTTVRWNGKDALVTPNGSNDTISAQLGDPTGSGGGLGSTDNFHELGTVVANCDIAEVIVYDVALSDSVRKTIETYLATKYGLVQWSVPTAGLQLWLKADNGVDTRNGRVSRWRDQSGNGNNAIESDPNRQPSLVNNVLNGKPVLRFDGVDDRLGFTGSKPMTKISLFTVFKNKSGVTGVPANYPGFVVVLGPGGIYGTNDHYLLKMRGIYGDDNVIVIGLGKRIDGSTNTINATATSIASYDEWRNINIISASTIFNTTVRWNGKDASVTTNGSDDVISAQLGDSTGSGGGIGSTDNFADLGTARAKCDIAELIVYDTVLSRTDRLAIEKYLNDKYQVTTGVNNSRNAVIPERFTLYQNYPNPFNPSTQIRFALPTESHVTIRVFNVLGQEVVTLADEQRHAGEFTILWNGTGSSGITVVSGMYFCRLEARSLDGSRSFAKVTKMMMLK